MKPIQNPVLRGFYPDPSIVRVGEDYYLANSTFEWFPGVPIHHSRDLVHWRLSGHALTRTSQLDLRGVVDSGGVWAPSLSYYDNQFWLIYTNVRTCGVGRPFKDIGIYLTTATDILGPWSEPVALNSIGFDPSLFHDDDGRKWLVNMEWDFRPGHSRFGGIVLQEYDAVARRLVGPMSKILDKNGILVEGPNLYKVDGWYYLMLAEGGTGWNHGISMARSRSVTGPYELDPQPLVLTSRDDVNLALQKAGHGELVQTGAGEWYLAHLASRPLRTKAPVNPDSPDHSDAAQARAGFRCVLGRETCLQRVVWSEDGWLRLAQGGHHPALEVPAPAGLPSTPWPSTRARDDFDSATLNAGWSTLRIPADESWLSLQERPGWVRLRGRESLFSLFEQSLLARRLPAFDAIAETCLEFRPTHFTHTAGLVCWYDTRTHYYLRVTYNEAAGIVLGIVLTDDGIYAELTESDISVDAWPRYYLRAQFAGAQLQFFASPDGQAWQKVGPVLNASKLSDDYGQQLHFTGTLVGLCAQDLGGTRLTADFDYFDLQPYSESL
jgi:xylan 1,4-beta-xylosidase